MLVLVCAAISLIGWLACKSELDKIDRWANRWRGANEPDDEQER